MKELASDSNRIPILKWTIRIIQFLGLCRPRTNIISFFTVASMLFMVFLQVLDISLNWESIASLKKLRFLPACFITMLKGAILVIKAKESLQVLDYLKYFWKSDGFDEETQKKFRKIFKITTIVVISYFVYCELFCVMIASLPWIDPSTKDFVLGDYTFCDKYTSWGCWFSMWLWQACLLLLQEIPVSCFFDSIFIIFTAYIYNGCELLKAAFKKLNTEDEFRRQLVLKAIVDQHHVIMKFVVSVNEFLTGFLLVQFWCSLWSLILYLYMMVIEGIPPKIADVVLFGALYAIFTFQILIYSLGGTIIQEQLKSLPNALFKVNWQDKGRTELRRDLAFMIFRGQNANVLSVGKMSELNLVLFISVIKNSLSVFALILQLDNS